MSIREQFEKWVREKHPVWFSHQIHDDTVRIEQLWEAYQAGFDLSVCQLERMLDAAATVMGEDGEDEDE